MNSFDAINLHGIVQNMHAVDNMIQGIDKRNGIDEKIPGIMPFLIGKFHRPDSHELIWFDHINSDEFIVEIRLRKYLNNLSSQDPDAVAAAIGKYFLSDKYLRDPLSSKELECAEKYLMRFSSIGRIPNANQ